MRNGKYSRFLQLSVLIFTIYLSINSNHSVYAVFEIEEPVGSIDHSVEIDSIDYIDSTPVMSDDTDEPTRKEVTKSKIDPDGNTVEENNYKTTRHNEIAKDSNFRENFADKNPTSESSQTSEKLDSEKLTMFKRIVWSIKNLFSSVSDNVNNNNEMADYGVNDVYAGDVNIKNFQSLSFKELTRSSNSDRFSSVSTKGVNGHLSFVRVNLAKELLNGGKENAYIDFRKSWRNNGEDDLLAGEIDEFKLNPGDTVTNLPLIDGAWEYPSFISPNKVESYVGNWNYYNLAKAQDELDSYPQVTIDNIDWQNKILTYSYVYCRATSYNPDACVESYKTNITDAGIAQIRFFNDGYITVMIDRSSNTMSVTMPDETAGTMVLRKNLGVPDAECRSDLYVCDVDKLSTSIGDIKDTVSVVNNRGTNKQILLPSGNTVSYIVREGRNISRNDIVSMLETPSANIDSNLCRGDLIFIDGKGVFYIKFQLQNVEDGINGVECIRDIRKIGDLDNYFYGGAEVTLPSNNIVKISAKDGLVTISSDVTFSTFEVQSPLHPSMDVGGISSK